MLRSPTSGQKTTSSRSENDLMNLEKEPSHQMSSPEGFITQRAKRPVRGSEESEPSDFSELKTMIQTMMSCQSDRLDKLESLMLNIKVQTSNIETTNTEIQKTMSFLSDQISTIDAQISNLEADRKFMAAELTTIQEKITSFERHNTKTSIEIRAVPKRSKETKAMLYETISQLSKTLNLHYSSSDIRDVTRGPSKKEQKTSTLTVEFSNTLVKSQYLAMAKKFNKNKEKEFKLNSTHLGFTETASPIFVDELLTTASKRLFYLTRNFIKQSHYNFCWTTNDRIFVKENIDTPYFQIKSETHLNSLTNLNTE